MATHIHKIDTHIINVFIPLYCGVTSSLDQTVKYSFRHLIGGGGRRLQGMLGSWETLGILSEGLAGKCVCVEGLFGFLGVHVQDQVTHTGAVAKLVVIPAENGHRSSHNLSMRQQC